MWDTRFDERDVKEIRTKTTTYLGVGAIAKIGDIAADLKLQTCLRYHAGQIPDR